MSENSYPDWVKSDEEKELYGAAIGLDAPFHVLNDKFVCKGFVNIKRRGNPAASKDTSDVMSALELNYGLEIKSFVTAVHEVSAALECTIYDPKHKCPRLLGAGGNGVVFLAQPLNKTGATHCYTALKVFVGDEGELFHFIAEHQLLQTAKSRGANVVTVGKIFIGKKCGGYEMKEIGTPAPYATAEHRAAMFDALLNLHKTGLVHRDARKENLIQVHGIGLLWIDFYGTAASLDPDPFLFRADYVALAKSLNITPDEKAVDDYVCQVQSILNKLNET